MTLAYDQWEAPASPLAQLDPRWKLAGIVIAMFIFAFLQTMTGIACALLIAVVLSAAARPPWRFLAPRLFAFAIFLVPFLIVLPLLDGWSGASAAVRVGGKASAIFLLGLVLVATAPFARTLTAAQR